MLKFYFCCGFRKCVFVKNGTIFAGFFRFRPWCPVLGVRTENTWPFSALKWAKNTENLDFPGLGAVLGETPADQT